MIKDLQEMMMMMKITKKKIILRILKIILRILKIKAYSISLINLSRKMKLRFLTFQLMNNYLVKILIKANFLKKLILI